MGVDDERGRKGSAATDVSPMGSRRGSERRWPAVGVGGEAITGEFLSEFDQGGDGRWSEGGPRG